MRERLDQPTDNQQGKAAEQEAFKRKGRACERFIVALPVEASAAQRLEIACAFADALTQKKAGYVLAIHDKAGNDINNPHFHLVAFDEHEKTGGRGRPRSVLGMARKHAIETWAQKWAEIHNRKMRGWGFGPECEISHLSFEKRGIERIAEIHEGPASRAMAVRAKTPGSNPQWKHIDEGSTRADANVIIREINQLTKENENDTGNRLGSTDRGHQKQGNGSSTPFRKDSQRGGANHLGNDGPIQNPCQAQPRASGDQPPPWLAGSRNRASVDPSCASPKPREKGPFSALPVQPVWLPIRRRRVRRVFLELIFLRDTLRARLATLGGRHHALPGNKIDEVVRKRATQDRSSTNVRQR